MVSYLPPEVMEIVLSSLACPEDGIGFALSSKYAYICFLSFLERCGMKLSKLLPIEAALHHRPFDTSDVRNQIGRIRDLGNGTSELQSTDLIHSSLPVYICPCKQITVGGMAHIAHGLFKHAQAEMQIPPLVPFHTHGSVFFQSEHQCIYPGSPNQDIQINSYFQLNGGKLQLVNWFMFDLNAYPGITPPDLPRSSDPDSTWLENSFSQVGPGFWVRGSYSWVIGG
ncbi:hypothetical protein N7481_007250 [Penicillium waksmanii]|uniref:uncharacterized protein n=1 Tax=Penicillium waksmanii TaxID=69791 RepID=UPI002546F846|nr:uncharacterized protein N7481_007250 [Penicillium waksmanii]KAJ5979952.1 hypothetical protein N7481_007250 [Penicillium waksmanii]